MDQPDVRTPSLLLKFLQRYLVLLLVTVSVAGFTATILLGLNPELAVVGASVLSLGLVWRLERLIPFRPDWNRNQGDLGVDLFSAAVLIALVDPLLKLLFPLAVVWVYALAGWQPLGSKLSLWLEIVLVLGLIELGKYGSHRLHHSQLRLWWLHAMHHSSQRLYVLNGLRFHPLNYCLNMTLALLPVMLLGASPEALLGYLAITQPVVLIQHANVDLRHGWLNWIFSTPEVHRWHHATEPDQANRNFGNALMLWDHVFGTFKPAAGFTTDKPVGLFADSRASYPASESYWTQLLSMFSPRCCAR